MPSRLSDWGDSPLHRHGLSPSPPHYRDDLPLRISTAPEAGGRFNTDPYATKRTPDNNWVKTGSHVMIVGGEAKAMMAGYPRDANPDPKKPYVMWPGSAYEHLMIPVK